MAEGPASKDTSKDSWYDLQLSDYTEIHLRRVMISDQTESIQEDTLRKKAGPTAQLQKTNQRTHGRILNCPTKQKPTQED